MTEKKQPSEPPSSLTSLPEELIVDIIARVQIWNCPTLSLVSKQFRSFLDSREVYARRCDLMTNGRLHFVEQCSCV
ncbi:unnamed protein product [Cochlearia groenlandica]